MRKDLLLTLLLLMLITVGSAYAASLEDRLLSKDHPLRFNAQEEIKNIDTQAQGELSFVMVQKLSDSDADVHAYAMDALSRIGVPGIPSLTGALQKGDLRNRLTALTIMKDIADRDWTNPETTDQVIPVLTKALQDPESEVRLAAANALGDLASGSNSPSTAAIPDLIKVLDDQNERVRCAAAVTLAKLHGPADKILPVLKNALTSKEGSMLGAWAIGLLGSEAVSAAPALIPLLKEEDSALRVIAAEALEEIGAGKSESLPVLSALLKDQHPGVRSAAARVLVKIVGPQDASLVPSLIEALKDTDRNVQLDAAQVLGKIGPAASAAVPALA